MGFAEKYNKFNTIFDIDIKDFEFMNGHEFIAKYGTDVVKIDGLYINKKGKFKDHPIAIISDEKILLDLPAHMTDTVNEILTDSESIDLIKKGLVGLKAREYVDKTYNKWCIGYEWCDL